MKLWVNHILYRLLDKETTSYYETNTMNLAESISCVDIVECQECIDAVAEMSFNEWPKECMDVGIHSVEEYAEDIRNNYLEPNSWPLIIVAFRGVELVGAVAIDPNDMECRANLKPWLASLLVKPQHRGNGIGGILISAVLKRGQTLGLEKMYVWCKRDMEKLYISRGFHVHEYMDDFCGHPVTIMEHDFCEPEKILATTRTAK